MSTCHFLLSPYPTPPHSISHSSTNNKHTFTWNFLLIDSKNWNVITGDRMSTGKRSLPCYLIGFIFTHKIIVLNRSKLLISSKLKLTHCLPSVCFLLKNDSQNPETLSRVTWFPLGRSFWSTLTSIPSWLGFGSICHFNFLGQCLSEYNYECKSIIFSSLQPGRIVLVIIIYIILQ
jgi:hypothetical protein